MTIVQISGYNVLHFEANPDAVSLTIKKYTGALARLKDYPGSSITLTATAGAGGSLFSFEGTAVSQSSNYYSRFDMTSASKQQLMSYWASRNGTSNPNNNVSFPLDFEDTDGNRIVLNYVDNRADVLDGDGEHFVLDNALAGVTGSRVVIDSSTHTYGYSYKATPKLPSYGNEGNEYTYSYLGTTIANVDKVISGSAHYEADEEIMRSVAKSSEDGESDSGNGDGEDRLEKKRWWIQCGAEAGDGLWIETGEMNTKVLGINNLNAPTILGAGDAIEKSKDALHVLMAQRSMIGAEQNRLEHTFNNVMNIAENTQDAESGIRDTDMAKEIVKYSLTNLLSQAGEAMMTQANHSNQGVLSLLQ